MKQIVCKSCGSKELVKQEGIFVCQHCNAKYSVEEIKKNGAESLMKRGWLSLEDSDWLQASEYFDKMLDIDPEYAPAYIGKLCSELAIENEADLANQGCPLDDYLNYKKALRFADADYRAKLTGYNQIIQERIKLERIEEERLQRYNELVQAKTKASTAKEYQMLAEQFRIMNDYKNVQELANECDALANKCDALKKRQKRVAIISVTVLGIACLLFIVLTIVDEKIRIKTKRENDNASFERARVLLQSSEEKTFVVYENTLNELNSISSSHEKYNEAQILKRKADSLLSEKCYKLGNKLFDEGKYSEVQSILDKISKNYEKYNEAQILKRKADSLLSVKNYGLGKELLDKRNYAEALPVLKKVNSEYYKEVNDMIVYADNMPKLTEAKSQLSAYVQNMELPRVSSKEFQSKLKSSDKPVVELQLVVMQFGVIAESISSYAKSFYKIESKYKSGEINNLKKELERLVTQARDKLKNEQRKEFPLLRQEFAKLLHKTGWRENIEVKAKGNGNSHLEFTNVMFANNANIDDFQKKLLIDTGVLNNIKLFRFKRVAYKWSKYDDEYTYYSYDTPADYVDVNENTMGEIKK